MRNPETLTNTLGELLAGVADRVVMLSATPVHLRSRDLFQLMTIVTEIPSTILTAFDAVLAANEPLVAVREALITRRVSAADFSTLLRSAQRIHC